MEDVVEKLAEKLNTLSIHLQSNRYVVNGLYNQAKQLREKALNQEVLENELSKVPHDPAEYETKYLELQRENQVLNHLIKEYDSAMHIIMSKYRAKTDSFHREKQELQLQFDKALDQEKIYNENLTLENLNLRHQLHSSFEVIRTALNNDEDDLVASELVRVQKENETLRELLAISQNPDSVTKLP
ncbi:hypothetical protein HK098_001029 [Nowakowskiella sp. JEL0407]|nr:hypothetical protein HK098_001029 [Nowakowskiella sp. JEL0407]